MQSTTLRYGLIATLALTLSVGLGAGCASTKEGPPQVLASVEVPARPPAQLSAVALEVFHAHGYNLAQQTKRQLTFEKPASKWDSLAYGNWMAGEKVWQRVTLLVVPENESFSRLDCDGRLITNKGEALEEPVKFGHLKHAPLQEMLQEIAARLQPPPAPPAN